MGFSTSIAEVCYPSTPTGIAKRYQHQALQALVQSLQVERQNEETSERLQDSTADEGTKNTILESP